MTGLRCWFLIGIWKQKKCVLGLTENITNPGIKIVFLSLALIVLDFTSDLRSVFNCLWFMCLSFLVYYRIRIMYCYYVIEILNLTIGAYCCKSVVFLLLLESSLLQITSHYSYVFLFCLLFICRSHNPNYCRLCTTVFIVNVITVAGVYGWIFVKNALTFG